MRGMAQVNDGQLRALLEKVQPDGAGMDALLRDLRQSMDTAANEVKMVEAETADYEGPPEMEIQPFEHHDVILLYFKSPLDFMNVAEKLGIRREGFTMKDGKSRKVGLNRVVPAERLLPLLK